MKWVTTSWTYCTLLFYLHVKVFENFVVNNNINHFVVWGQTILELSSWLYYWAFHILPQICTASAWAHFSCSPKQMKYRFEVIYGPPCILLPSFFFKFSLDGIHQFQGIFLILFPWKKEYWMEIFNQTFYHVHR